MGSMLDLLGGATGSLDIEGLLGDQVGTFGTIISAVRQLVDAPPGDAGAFLAQLQTLSLPELNMGGDFSGVFSQLAPSLQGQLGGLTGPVTQALQGLQGHSRGGASALGPLITVIGQFKTLIDMNWSEGWVVVDAGGTPPTPPTPPDPNAPVVLPPAPTPPVIVAPAQVASAKAIVDALPADLSAKPLLTWLHAKVGVMGRSKPYVRAIPLLDDIRDPLDSLVRWDGLDGVGFSAELNASLQAIGELVTQDTQGALMAPFSKPDAQAAMAALPAVAFRQHADALADALQAMTQAVAANDAARLATELTKAQMAASGLDDDLTIIAAQTTELDALQQGLLASPDALETRVARLLLLLSPPATFSDLTDNLGTATLPTQLSGQVLAPVNAFMGRIQEMADNLLRIIDVAEVLQPVTNTVQQIHDAIEQVEQAVVQLMSTAHAQFAQAQSAISSIGLTQVADQAEAAMDTAVHTIRDTVLAGVKPATDALTQAVQAIEGVLGSFDPEQLTEPVRSALQAVRDIFESDDSEVKQALAQIKKLKTIAGKLDQLSFEPVANEVIGAIQTIQKALEGLDQTNLPDPMPSLIREAMSVLPDSIKPITDPLISELAELIEQGPVPLLSELKDLPKPLFEEIRKLEPKTLLGDRLGTPFEEVREKLADFQPDQWIDKLETELKAVRERIRAAADPRGVLQPLNTAFDQFMAQLEQFKPGDLLKPVTDGIEGALQQLDGVLPDLGFMADLQALLARVHAVSQFLKDGVAVMQHFADKIAALTDPSASLDQWLDEILAKLTDVAALQPGFIAISQAVTGANANGLNAAWQSGSGDFRAALMQMDARAQLGKLVMRRQALLTAMNAPGVSINVAIARTWVTDFKPDAPARSAGFLSAAQWLDGLKQADAHLAEVLTGWDARYLPAEGPLGTLTPVSPAVADVRSWLREAVQRQVGAPLRLLLGQLSGVGQVLQTIVAPLATLANGVADRLDLFTNTIGGLPQLYADLQGLLKRLSEIDLDQLSEEVNALYDTLLDQARALDPRKLEQTLSDKFNELLKTLSVDTFIPKDLREGIRTDYEKVRKIVDTLDPQLLLVEPMQAIYEKDILPLLDVFDISETVQALVDFLLALDEKLGEQMDRVDTAYLAMLAAAPGDNGGGSASVSVGVSA